nr:hypothetical protein [uncultured Desulfobulbus sp.]
MESSAPALRPRSPAKDKSVNIEDANRQQRIARILQRFSVLSENDQKRIFTEFFGAHFSYVDFLNHVVQHTKKSKRKLSLEYPYVAAFKQFKIEQQLQSSKAIAFKRKYYLQFREIREEQKAAGEDLDKIYRDLSKFLSELSVKENGGDKKKRLYFSSKSLQELMELIDSLEEQQS